MRERLRWGTGVLVALAAASAGAQGGSLPADSLERARSWGRWFEEGTSDSLFSAAVPGMRGVFASRESLAAAQQEFAAQAGRVFGTTEERFVWRGGNRQYWRTVNTERAPEPLVIRFVMRPDGRLSGLGISLASQVPPVDSGGPVIVKP